MYVFKKIKNDHAALRDDVIYMDICSDIKVGEPVLLFGPPRDVDVGSRMVQTSPVRSVDAIDGLTTRFTTESGSVYEITDIGDEKPV